MVKGITHILKNNAAVQELIGENVTGDKYKVYPTVCPKPESAPFIVVKMIGRVPINCKMGVPNDFTYTYEVYAFHQNYDEAVSIAEAAEAALSLPDGGEYNNVKFDEIRYVNRSEGYDEKYNLFGQITTIEAQVDES